MSVIVADTLRSRVAGAAVTTTEGLNVGGALTATSYYGDGSTLTGIGQTVNVGTSNLYVVGIATIGLGLTLADNVRAKFGNSGDLAGDNNHFSATVTSSQFNGKSKIEQHKMVYNSLKGKMGNELHALSIKTKEQ